MSFLMAMFADVICLMGLRFVYMWKYGIYNQIELSEDYGFGMLAMFGFAGVFVVSFVVSIFISAKFLKNFSKNS